MRPIVPVLLLALAALAAAPTLADAELVLRDGRVLRGVDVRLEAAHYLLETGDGEVVAIPAALVSELRLLDERLTEEGVTLGPARELTGTEAELDPLPKLGEAVEPKKRPGWREGAPRDLAGGAWTIHDPTRQNAALGEPSRFQQSLPFRFKPVHAWDREVDVLARGRSTWPRRTLEFVWRPTEAFDHSEDVLASGRSTWSTASRATSWNPSNSFSRLRADLWWGREPLPEPLEPSRRDDACGWCDDISNAPKPFTVPRGVELDPGDCARRLFARQPDLETLDWAALEGEAWDALPAGLYRARTADGPRALFATRDDACRLIAGDLRELLGIDLTEEDALTYAVTAWNGLHDPLPLPLSAQGQVDLAFLLVQLFETATSGREASAIELLGSERDLERVVASEPAECSRSASFRRAQRGNVERKFERPRAEIREDTVRVAFTAWIALGGEVHAYVLTFADDGRVELSRETLAQHVGVHDDRD